MVYDRNKMVKQAESWLGCRESDGSHRKIIDVYNSQKSLPRGYAVTYTDAWCATFWSACAIALGYEEIIPLECSCYYLIEKAKKMGIWMESDSYVPSAGDAILYDWDDTGKGDNTGSPEHVGMVQKVVNGTIYVIEGNYSNSVKIRKIAVNGRYIRGFIVPKYTSTSSTSAPSTSTTKPTATKSVTASDYAKSYDKTIAGTYEVEPTEGLNVRHGAGTSKKIMTAIPKGIKVKNYGYYTTVLGTKWLYIQFTLNGVKYTGFASGKYLKKC